MFSVIIHLRFERKASMLLEHLMLQRYRIIFLMKWMLAYWGLLYYWYVSDWHWLVLQAAFEIILLIFYSMRYLIRLFWNFFIFIVHNVTLNILMIKNVTDRYFTNCLKLHKQYISLHMQTNILQNTKRCDKILNEL